MLLKLLIIFLCTASAVHGDVNKTAPRVKTSLGGVKGYYKTSPNGRKYEAYEGIPYALPPTGKLRFKPPHPVSGWIGELSATKFGSPCLQYTHIPTNPNNPDKVEGAEDCLYLNIYTPVRENSTNKILMPVLFWIHSGAFQYGSGMLLYDAKYLMDHDVVFVTINYRLGPMGFLSTEDEVVPGNMGLKDQSMALRWVSDNIECFGGDSKKITLVGMSAGGASVHYHYLSQLSAGLFQGGMSISGTAFDCWAQARNSLEKAKRLSVLMGCPTTSTTDMIRCLRYRPARALVQATAEFHTFFYSPFAPFGPVVEKSGNAPFIDRTPVEVVSSGDVQDVPWITSVVSEEGLYPVAEFIAKEKTLEYLNDNWEHLAPDFLEFNYTIPSEKHAESARLIKEHYLGSRSINRHSTEQLVQMVGDRFFAVDSEKAARMQAKVNRNPVWYYYYSYEGAESFSFELSNNTEKYGVSHGDDALIVLEIPYSIPTSTQEDRKMQRKLIEVWISYARDGIPKVAGVEWPRLDPSAKELHYLHFASPTKIGMDSSGNFGEKEFWNSIPFAENEINTGEKNESYRILTVVAFSASLAPISTVHSGNYVISTNDVSMCANCARFYSVQCPHWVVLLGAMCVHRYYNMYNELNV